MSQAPEGSVDGEEQDFVSLMRSKLPEYMVNCLLVSGFDVQEVVASMDVTNTPGNSIEQIEHFIADNGFASMKEYTNSYLQSTSSVSRFLFPPGHRLRLANFVLDLKKRLDASKSQTKKPLETLKSSYKVPIKPQSTVKHDNDSDTSDSDSIASVTNQVRRSISSWIKRQPTDQLQELKEDTHFSVTVSYVPKSNVLSVCVRCQGCKARIQLHKAASKSMNFSISNWTRHVKKCSKLHVDPTQQPVPSLRSYFSPPFRSEPSGASTDQSSDLLVRSESGRQFVDHNQQLQDISSGDTTSLQNTGLLPPAFPQPAGLTNTAHAKQQPNQFTLADFGEGLPPPAFPSSHSPEDGQPLERSTEVDM